MNDKKVANCPIAYYIKKPKSEIFLMPKLPRDKIEDVYLNPPPNIAAAHKNNLTTFPYELIKDFPKLKGVAIYSYMINKMVFDDSMWQIDELVFGYNNITSFKSTLKKKNSNISFLTLVENPITRIDRDSFANMFDMRALWLTLNKISTIHPEAFKDMPLLTEVNLWDNQLTSLSVEFIKSMSPSVVHLNLYSNQITELPEGVLEKFNNFSYLNLAQNNFTSFDATLLKLTSVKNLHLYFNAIKFLNMQGVKNLNNLYLNSNSLTSFNASEIGITSCRELEVANNKLESFNLTGVENLQIVKMSKNNLTTISEDMFPENFEPTSMAFDNNQIKSIEKNFITTFGKQFAVAFQNNPCVKLMNPKDPKSINLDSCFKNFEKEKAMEKLKIIEE
jgi:Leucine-rich repeat (LRR) protein